MVWYGMWFITEQLRGMNRQRKYDQRWRYPRGQARNLCSGHAVGGATAVCSQRISKRERRGGNPHLDERPLWHTHTHTQSEKACSWLMVMLIRAWILKELELWLITWAWKSRFCDQTWSERRGALLLGSAPASATASVENGLLRWEWRYLAWSATDSSQMEFKRGKQNNFYSSQMDFKGGMQNKFFSV